MYNLPWWNEPENKIWNYILLSNPRDASIRGFLYFLVCLCVCRSVCACIPTNEKKYQPEILTRTIWFKSKTAFLFFFRIIDAVDLEKLQCSVFPYAFKASTGHYTLFSFHLLNFMTLYLFFCLLGSTSLKLSVIHRPFLARLVDRGTFPTSAWSQVLCKWWYLTFDLTVMKTNNISINMAARSLTWHEVNQRPSHTKRSGKKKRWCEIFLQCVVILIYKSLICRRTD